LIVWRDVTKEVREAEIKKKEKQVLEEQQLANLMHNVCCLMPLAWRK
jgi:hypothetical protein